MMKRIKGSGGSDWRGKKARDQTSWSWSRDLDLVPIGQAMVSPVAVLPEQPSLEEVRRMVRDTRHNGFPIVKATPAGQVSRS
jgi:hypothetical protein